MMIQSNKLELHKYIQAYLIDIETCTNNYIRRWNLAIYEMHKKVKNEVVNNIRLYISAQDTVVKQMIDFFVNCFVQVKSR